MKVPGKNDPDYDEFCELIKTYYERSEIMSVEELVRKLASIKSGANIHLVSKASFYLEYFEKDSQERFKYGPRYDRLRELKMLVLWGIEFNDWEQLDTMLSSWW